MFQLFLKGGPVMLLLLMCSGLGVYIVVQKWLYLQSNKSEPKDIEAIESGLARSGREGVARDGEQVADVLSALGEQQR